MMVSAPFLFVRFLAALKLAFCRFPVFIDYNWVENERDVARQLSVTPVYFVCLERFWSRPQLSSRFLAVVNS